MIYKLLKWIVILLIFPVALAIVYLLEERFADVSFLVATAATVAMFCLADWLDRLSY